MESTTKTSVAEPFLKIDTIWSEAEENFENFTIKEEIVSDIEPDIKDIVEKNANDEVDNSGDNFKQSGENGKGCNSNFSSSVTSASRQVLRKRTKNKHQNLIIDDLELPNDTKSSCLHDTKSFKIVNRRLRCGDCRSLVCPECFKIMFSTLHNHFLGFDTSNCGLYSCKYCCFPFQSVCALQVN